jgi:Anthrone oxygenase
VEVTLKSLTIAGAGLFSLWALYISLVEHPARLSAGPAAGVAQFRQSYRRAAPWQVSAAAIAFVSGALASSLTSQLVWALGGLSVGLAIPFTLLVIMPTNRRLLDTTSPDAEVTVLLVRWGRLHWVRSMLGLGALVLLLSRVRVI